MKPAPLDVLAAFASIQGPNFLLKVSQRFLPSGAGVSRDRGAEALELKYFDDFFAQVEFSRGESGGDGADKRIGVNVTGRGGGAVLGQGRGIGLQCFGFGVV